MNTYFFRIRKKHLPPTNLDKIYSVPGMLRVKDDILLKIARNSNHNRGHAMKIIALFGNLSILGFIVVMSMLSGMPEGDVLLFVIILLVVLILNIIVILRQSKSNN